jgi:hypothetical protein
MSAKRKNKITVGPLTVTIYRWKNTSSGKSGWRFAYKENGKWKYATAATLADAELAATTKLTALQANELDWPALTRERREFLTLIHHAVTPDQQDALLSSLNTRRQSLDIAAATERFLAFKLAAKGHQTAHLEQMARDLRHLASHFPNHFLTAIHLATLSDWWTLRTGTAGRDRQQGIRRTLVTFYRWAKLQGFAGNEAVTVADRLPSLAANSADLYVYTPAEMATLLHHVTPEFLPCILFGGFAGLRPEEIAPKNPKATKKRPNPPPPKPGLQWDHIDWQFKVIRLPKEVSKVKKARIIPLHPVLLQWFQHIGADATWKGRVCKRDAATARETTRLGKILDQQFNRTTGWPDDALRHSYGSYRNAVIRKLSQVAEEMGTSEEMLHNHYHNPKTSEEGAEWFTLDPQTSSEKFRFLQQEMQATHDRMTA